MHDRADDPFFTEVRKGVITARSMPVASYRLGLQGVCDVVEFTQALEGAKLPGREGFFRVAPIEYKRGKPKQDKSDEAQLCAQAMCLEEMLSIDIPVGYLYYGRTRHRVQIELNSELRQLVTAMAQEMHNYFFRGYTPKAKLKKGCKSCSLLDICLPDLESKTTLASSYIRFQVERDE